MQNLDTKKEISIPKRRLRPPRHQKTSRYQKQTHPFIFGSLHNSHAILCASRNDTRKASAVWDGGGRPLQAKTLRELCSASLQKVYVTRPRPLNKIALSLGIGNGGGKQGRGNQPPYRRYGPDTEIQHRPREPHELAKTSRILSKREADTEFQYRPHIVDPDTIADAIFADAISEPPTQRIIYVMIWWGVYYEKLEDPRNSVNFLLIFCLLSVNCLLSVCCLSVISP